MTRRVALLASSVVLLALFSLAVPQDIKVELVASTEALSPAEEKKAFRLPPGFEAELVAAEPDIAKPMNIAFDDRGRLWVTDTLEYPFPATPGKKPRDCVKILEDFGPEGRARKITTFADGLNIPIGLLPLPSLAGQGAAALVHGIPAVHRFTDTDGDGKADKKEVLYETYGARDTHGMTNAFTLSFDGWVYACHGFSNDSTVKGRDGSTVKMNSGNVYRFRPDGSRVEQITWGQVNPFGLALDPLGNLYSADCHSLPIYQLLRGAYYPSFGKPHDGLGYGPEMMKHHHGSTGLCGVAYYAADHFPKEYHGTLFVGNVVTSRINHDRIAWKGSSPQAIEQPDFLKSVDPWFRPVDIKLGPDGALYVADFYNCIIGHYEVDLRHPRRDRHRGRIWRIVYRGPDGKGKPAAPRADWSKASIKELIEDLGHPNLTVRMLATHQLVGRGEIVVKAVKDVAGPKGSDPARTHALWVLERLKALDDETLTAAATGDKETLHPVHTQRILSERPSLTMKHRELLGKGLQDAYPNVRRAAADALGRHPATENLDGLLELIRKADREDTHLRHVARMALRDSLTRVEGWAMKYSRDERAPLLVDVALGIHTQESATFLQQCLGRHEIGDLARVAEHIARRGTIELQERTAGFLSKDRPDDLGRQTALFLAFERGINRSLGNLGDQGRAWAWSLAGKLLASRDAAQVQAGLALAGTHRMHRYKREVVARLLDNSSTEGQQLAALDALIQFESRDDVIHLVRVLEGAERTFKVRQQAAALLGRLDYPAAREALVKQVQTSPAGVQAVIAGALAGSRAGAEELLKVIESGKASARLLQERTVATRLRESRPNDLDRRVAKLTTGLPAADLRIAELLTKRQAGFQRASRDVTLGQKVFEKNCANCHQIAGKGQRVGPQLDGIGIRGVERLLEDTLDPSRNVDQAFRTTILNLKSGQSVRGLLLREEGGQYVMADDQGKERRIKVEDVEERTVSLLSTMPANLADQVPEADFYHLLAYLLAQRPAEK